MACAGVVAARQRLWQRCDAMRHDYCAQEMSRSPTLTSASTQVITCAASDSQDVVLKKSLYLYITTWAAANPELMLLTINMLLKDCGDQDPTIRGLALRSLCSLRIANLTEYLVRRLQLMRAGQTTRHSLAHCLCLTARYSAGFLRAREYAGGGDRSLSCVRAMNL